VKGAAAFLLSIALHGLLAAGLALYITQVPAPDELAQLDLTSVDLSFAETPDETLAPSAPAAEPMPPTPPPKPSEPEALPSPEAVQATDPSMPAPDTTDLPRPDPPREQLETPPAPVVAAPRQAKVDAPPRPRRAIRPDYPRESRKRGEQGDVTLEIDVNAQGTVDAVRVARSSGFPLLDEAAEKAALAARFTPANSGGRPVPSTARLTLEFKLK